MNRRSAMGAAALALTTCTVAAWAHPVGYAEMMARLRTAEATGNVRVVRIGFSVKGRVIPLVAIGPRDAAKRVLVLCRQHGDEPVSTEAALRVVEHAAHPDGTPMAALGRVQLLVVPMVNPDGAERLTRLNAHGVDLNRDWVAQSQPETRAVAALFRRVAPQVVLDEHEWTSSDESGSDSLESLTASDRVARAIQREAVAAGTAVRVHLLRGSYGANADPRLAHRYFQTCGASALLLETTPAVPPDRRLALYDRIIVRVGQVSALYAGVSAAPGSVGQLAPVFPRTAPNVPDKQPPISVLVMIALGGAALLLVRLPGTPTATLGIARDAGGLRRVPLIDVADLAARLQRRRAVNL